MGNFTLNIGKISGQQINVGSNVTATQNNNYDNKNNNIDEVLHIIGEAEFGNDDQIAFKDGGIKTIIVYADQEPYFDVLKKEIERQREDNKILKYWHISAHGDRNKGILFGKKWIEWEAFYDLISPYDDLEILFLNACESVDVADKISGSFKYILATAIEIPTDDAMIATKIFWKNIVNGNTAEEAVNAIKTNIPDFAGNIRLRTIF